MLLTMGILTSFICPVEAWATPSSDAVNAAARALYVQQGWDQWADYSKHEYIDPNISHEVQNYAGLVMALARAVQDQYVSYTFHF